MVEKMYKSFRCRKWALVSICLVSIVTVITVLCISLRAINNLDRNDHWNITEDNKDTTKTFIINVCAVAIALQLLGLWGAYKEHYYTCITYGVLISLIGCAAVLSALQSGYPLVWILTIWFFTSSFIALSFARRIRVRRLLELTTITYNMGQTRLVCPVPVFNNYMAPDPQLNGQILTAGTLVTASLYPPRPPSYVESEAMSTTYKTTSISNDNYGEHRTTILTSAPGS